MKELTFSETKKQRLNELDACLERNIKERAAILMEVYQDELWRYDGFKSLEDWAIKRHGWAKDYCYKNLRAAQFMIHSPLPEKEKAKLTSERQVRALAEYPEEIHEEVLKSIPAKEVTASRITEAAEVVIHRNKPEAEPQRVQAYDTIGYPIPHEIEPLWQAAEAASKDLVRRVKDLRQDMRDAYDRGDRYMAEVSNTILTDMDKLYRQMKNIAPYAVCTSCDGQSFIKNVPCNHCKGRGYISEFLWQLVPADIKRNRA